MPITDDDALLSALEQAVGAAPVALQRVRGGDTAAAYRVDLADGRRVFAKTHASPPPLFFGTEAAGLAWLRAADAVLVPEVLAVSDGTPDGPPLLVLEWIEEGAPGSGTERALGVDLARVHDSGAPCFGREDRRTTGSRGLPNEPHETWSAGYAANRLLPLARLAHDGAALAPATIAALERLAGSLDRFADGEPASRLHGDLWGGNRLVDRDGRSWLVDPAAQGGHREFDLAMMRLFGGFAPQTFAAYHDAHPLHAGWEERVALHQIAPLVIHAVKFGGGYVAAATAAINRY